jgi:hypothetical protein
MKALYEQYYHLCCAQRDCIKQGADDSLVETIEKKEQVIREIKQLNQPATDAMRGLLHQIAALEKENIKSASSMLNDRRKQAIAIDKNRKKINQYI